MNDDKKLERKDKTIFVLGVFVAVFVTSISGFLVYQSNHITNTENTVTAPEVSKPETTSKPQSIDYKNTEIQVLNASKTKGLAKKYADKLTSQGYTQVETGNSSESIAKSTLFAPNNVDELMKLIGIDDYEYKKSDSIKIIVIN